MTDRDQLHQSARLALKLQLKADQILGLDALPLGARWSRRSTAPTSPSPASQGQARSAPPSSPPRSREPENRPVRRHRPPVPDLIERLGSKEQRRLIELLDQEVAACERCGLSESRTLGVPGEGNVDADLMFIGEGPGRDEDLSGRPFVGRAGELLSRILKAMGFSRETVFIANIVKCRPPGNRDPKPSETSACRSYLERQIEIIRPRVICTLGLPATSTLLAITGGISEVRGKQFRFGEIPVVLTYHPAYLLRNPAGKAQVWQDVQLVARLVEEAGGVIPHPEVLKRASGG